MDIFANMADEEINNLKIGDVISAYDAGFTLRDSSGVQQRLKDIIYLGEVPEETKIYEEWLKNNGTYDPSEKIRVLNFFVFLRNNETLIWAVRDSDVKQYFKLGWLKTTKRKYKTDSLLKEIRLPREKESIEIVSQGTRIKLPNNIKNKLLNMIGYSEEKDYFDNNTRPQNE